MTVQQKVSVNAWRRVTPENADWAARLQPGHPNKYFIVSCDNHANEPLDFLSARVEQKYRERIPHVVTEKDGTQWLISEGWPPQPVKIARGREDLLPTPEKFENFEIMAAYSDRMEDEDVLRQAAGRDVPQRIKDRESQGIDAEIIFPQKGTLCFATPDASFSGIMCRAWNRWAKDYFAEDWDRSLPMAMIMPGILDEAIKEIQWAAQNGFHGILLPNRPIFSRKDQPKNTLEYNDRSLEPLWAAIAETGLPITLHVATGEDPRAVGGRGAAINAYVCHSLQTTIEPLVQMISSGVFERNPTLTVSTIESGIGWVPFVIDQMDYAFRAHHMWVRPVIPNLPSEYYRRHCAAAFIDEPVAVVHAVEQGFEDNMLWSSDYPHHEGSYPYCAASIQRQMNALTETQREKILGLNAARIFRIKQPLLK